MTQTIDRSRSLLRGGGLLTGVLALVLPIAGCGGDEARTTSSPTPIAISPSSASPSSVPASAPSPSEPIQDAAGAVAAAETAVADSTTVEVSRDDDSGAVQWEVTVRVGDEGRELRLAADGSVLSNQPDPLDESQLGELPQVTATDAIEVAEGKVPAGVVDDVELTRESGKRLWDVAVEVAGGNDWELWIDASTGKVVHEERD